MTNGDRKSTGEARLTLHGNRSLTKSRFADESIDQHRVPGLGGIGNKSRGYIIKQSVIALHAIVDAIANDELSAVDPDRWEEIPDRGSRIRTDDKWPDEWAE